MWHSLVKFSFILVLVKIDQLDSRAVEVVFTGQGCECKKHLPYHINVPVPPPVPESELRSYGYKVEVPPQARATYSYSFDFVVEEPVPPPPKPVNKANLFASIDKITLPKPDCEMENFVPPKHAPPPAVKACQFDKNKVCTCGMCGPAKLDFDYEVDTPVMGKSCLCGQCSPLKPLCGYVLSKIQTNRIGRSKRDVSPKKPLYIDEIRNYIKSLKIPQAKKSKIVKRDIKGEYDMLKKEEAALDLTIPEIIQYMPETLMPNFKRGKCNIGCENCINKHEKEEQNKNTTPETANKDNKQEQQQSVEIAKGANNSKQTLPYQQLNKSPRFAAPTYLKRSINQYQYPCYPPLMPPPYIPSPLHMATLAENPGNPIWYQPRPLIDPNGDYVYDRLGHKYEVKNGSLKLVTPQISDEVNVSAPSASVAANTGENAQSTAIATATDTTDDQMLGKVNSAIGGDKQLLQPPIVGAPGHHDPSYDPQMDKVIRDIIYQHPDFIDATEHAPGSLSRPQGVQRDETMQFLGKLIQGRLDNWFGGNEEAHTPNLQDLNRYSRQTGTSIKFIPVVTVDKAKLNRYRRGRAEYTT